MRKIIFIAFWAMLMIMPAVGQVTFGVRAGGAYSSLVQKVEGTYNAGARFGFSLAGLADIHLYKGLSLRPELAFVNQGGSFYSNPQVEGAKNSFNKCSYYSIQVPVNLAYTFIINDVQLGVYAGPALDFSLFGKMKTENQNVDIHFGQTKEADLKTFDLCQCRLACGLQSLLLFRQRPLRHTGSSRYRTRRRIFPLSEQRDVVVGVYVPVNIYYSGIPKTR